MSTPDTTADETHQTLEERIQEFYRVHCRDDISAFAQRYPKETTAFTLDHAKLAKFDHDMAEDLIKQPKEMLEDYFEPALHEYDLPADIDLSGADVHVTNLPEWRQYGVGQWSPKEVKGELVSVIGQVTKQTGKVMLQKVAKFECQRCGTEVEIPQDGIDLQTPYQCQGCERQGPFQQNHNESESVDFQITYLQAPPEQSIAGGEEIEVWLEEDLVGECEAGERVEVTAILNGQQKTEQSAVEELYAEAYDINHTDQSVEDIDIDPHEDDIERLSNDPNILAKMWQSIAPRHHGDEMTKKAMALQLVGGVNRRREDGTLKRGTIHMLTVGDPGTNKSGLLRLATKLWPRSIFTTGKGSTKAGLTLTAEKQEGFGDGGYTLKAGALVEAHNGLAAIDELDKMADEDKDGLLECMSDQTVSRSVAGMNPTAQAKTTISAAANPREGRFHDGEPIGQQIDLAPALVSRFDLLFTVMDEPDKENDRQVAQTVLRSAEVDQAKNAGDSVDDSDVTPVIEWDLLRAYIASARQIDPQFTPKGKKKLEDWYVEWRQTNDSDGPIPVTARKLEAGVRLSEAVARTRHSHQITVEHVEIVLEIIKSMLRDIGIDPETGQFDADVIETGRSHTQNKRKQTVRRILQELTENGEEPTLEELEDMVADAGHDADKVEHDVDKYKDQGEVWEVRGGKLRWVD